MQTSTHLLTAAQEVELTIHIRELLRCEQVREDLKADLGRIPHNAEWAEACGASDVASFTDDMTLRMSAKTQMIQCNQRLVMSVARKYLGRGMELSDLIAEGIVGLIKAVERFDHTRGFKFSTYSHWWIRQAMNRAICEQGRIVRCFYAKPRPSTTACLIAFAGGKQGSPDFAAKLRICWLLARHTWSNPHPAH